jgi:hypothetical protein
MRLRALLLIVALSSARLGAQDGSLSSETVAPCASAEASTSAAIASEGEADGSGALPVSLDRIREALSKPPQMSTPLKLDFTPDFSVQIQQEQAFQAILSSLDFTSGPPVPGGLYAYEQQRLIWNKVDRPLSQPYAAFSGGELITLAVEGLMQKYLGGALLSAIGDATRESAERAATEEVSRAIRDYCAGRPDAGRSLQVCSVDALSR